MILNRNELLLKLTEASVAVAKKPGVSGAQEFHFRKDSLYAFSGEILARVKNPFVAHSDMDCSVSADDMIEVLAKMPDKEVEIVRTESELEFHSIHVNPTTEKRTRGRRKAGISCAAANELPIEDVPKPDEWHAITEHTLAAIRSVVGVCSHDPEMALATCVHVTPDRVEGCDNARLLRIDGPTGFPGDVMIPAEHIKKTKELELVKVSLNGGWVHFRTVLGGRISICCMEGEYPDVGAMLKMAEPLSLILPKELPDILKRAEMLADEDKKVTLTISDGKIFTRSSRTGCWYKEMAKTKYTGRRLQFSIVPATLREAIKLSRKVLVDENKLKLMVGNKKLVVCLEDSDTPEKPEKDAQTDNSAEGVDATEAAE